MDDRVYSPRCPTGAPTYRAGRFTHPIAPKPKVSALPPVWLLLLVFCLALLAALIWADPMGAAVTYFHPELSQ